VIMRDSDHSRDHQGVFLGPTLCGRSVRSQATTGYAPQPTFEAPSTIDRVGVESDYSMTSSARARIDGGTVRPSALAVLRLMISSTFVDWTTGSSAGFSPLRTRPV
jgi:hypothetical protein